MNHNLEMTLSELLKPALVLAKLPCASKDELISKLAAKVYEAGTPLPLSQKELLETINTREQIGGTLLPSGLSLPHARLKGFEDFIIVIATPAQPLYHDGQQIILSAMMITSQSGGPWYLEVLAALTKMSRNREYFTRLCSTENASDFLKILKESDPELAG